MSDASQTRRTSDRMLPEDWDLIFEAVAWRLRQSAREAMAETVRAAVEDCVQSLEVLHAELGRERGYMRRTELALRQTRADLTAAQAELAKVQAGERRPRHLTQNDGLTELPTGANSASG